MVFGGFQKSSLIDYPDKIAAVVFTQGCNFRCRYCHNPELLPFKKRGTFSQKYILDFLKKRQGKLDGVVITGGEPTLHKGLSEFIKRIKKMGFLVKLDTNGSNPEMLRYLLENALVDYVAMDVKAPLEKYKDITGVSAGQVALSINLLLGSLVDYEFRTTVVRSLLPLEDFEELSNLLSGAKRYFLQKCDFSSVYDSTLKSEKNYSERDFKKICRLLRKTVGSVIMR